MLEAGRSRGLDFYLVGEVPEPTRAMAAWIGQRPPDEPLLLTRMSWQSGYIPVLERLAPDRYRIISDWLPVPELRDFALSRHPAYVVTQASDGDLLAELCRATGLKARADRVLVRFGRLAALPLEPGGCEGPG